jgi:hypothetical protein
MDFGFVKQQRSSDKLVGASWSKAATYRPSSDLVNEARNKCAKNLYILHAQRIECRLFTILALIAVNVQLALLNFLLLRKSFCGREI